MQAIQEEATGARQRWRKKNKMVRLRKRISDWYESFPVQSFVTIAILCNAVAEAIKLQLRPDLPGANCYSFKCIQLVELFDNLEYFFTFFFLVELLVNMAGKFFLFQLSSF